MVLTGSLITLLLLLNLLWLLIISVLIFKAYTTYKSLTVGIDKKDFAAVLADIKRHVSTVDKNQTHLQTRVEEVNQLITTHIQKIGFVRYNPFGDTGGDQSFCLCLLDSYNTGILITSLHTRQQTRIYTKQIVNGLSAEKTELSKEEALCLKNAKQWSKR